MRPPSRSRKQLKLFTPNSPPEGLNPVNEAPSLTDERETHACRVFRNVLKPNGWRSFPGGVLQDWEFIPGSLLKNYTRSDVTDNGIHGVHYARGWLALAKMLKKYGQNYAPARLPNDPDSSDDENSMTGTRRGAIHGDVNAGKAATDAAAAAIASAQEDASHDEPRQHQVQDAIVDAEGEEQEAGDGVANVANGSANNAGMGVKGEDEDVHPTDNSRLSVTLDCLKKCREEVTWMKNNPRFHDIDDTRDRMEVMRDTIDNIYNQIYNYNQADNDE